MNRTKSFVELGCGTGFVSLGLASLFNLPGTGIDIQADLGSHFLEGVQANKIETKLDFRAFDIRQIKSLMEPETTELCVFNPPHYIEGRGQSTDDDIRGLTRTADEEICDTFCKAASFVLKTKGYFSTIITPQNFENWMLAFRRQHLSVKTITPVYGHRDRNARLLLIKGIKNGGTGFLKVFPPVFLV